MCNGSNEGVFFGAGGGSSDEDIFNAASGGSEYPKPNGDGGCGRDRFALRKKRCGEMSKDPKSTYYDQGGIETLEIIRAKLTPEQFRGYVLGNIIKYACRLNWKGQEERDIEKVYNYSNFLMEQGKEEE